MGARRSARGASMMDGVLAKIKRRVASGARLGVCASRRVPSSVPSARCGPKLGLTSVSAWSGWGCQAAIERDPFMMY
jgi:hypothetical protein